MRQPSLDRRDLFRLAGLTGLTGVSAAGVSAAGMSAAVAEQSPRIEWVPVGSAPIAQIASSSAAEAELLHPTLLPLRSLTGNPSSPVWALWAWHHDTTSTPHLHIWTADKVEGPYTLGPTVHKPSVPYANDPVTGRTYTQGHFSSGDIVWDSAQRRLVSTPHSVMVGRPSGLAETPQDSFMMESTDGITWNWLGGVATPRLTSGPVTALDSNHTGYGRLLRDLDGRVTRFQGEYWWIYRGGHHMSGATDQSYSTPMLAAASSLGGPWRKVGKAFDTIYENLTLVGFDSFILTDDTPSVFYTVGSPVLAPTQPFYTQAQAGTMTFLTPGEPVPVVAPTTSNSPNPSDPVHPPVLPGAVFTEGYNVTRDANQQQYLVQVINDPVPGVDGTSATFVCKKSEIWLHKAVVA